nr:MAG TPA: hypothetical protein [Caudoviricetes sp.]
MKLQKHRLYWVLRSEMAPDTPLYEDRTGIYHLYG